MKQMRTQQRRVFKLPLAKQNDCDLQSFSNILADRITSGNNQHAVILFEGKTGAGKSVASLRLAFDTSLLLAERLGKNPSYYFNMNHIGILTGEETIKITKNIKKHCIYILDDAGAEGLSARNWQSDINETMTKLMQTFRTQENILILSSPDKGFIDKIARTLIHFKITMVAAYYDIGVTLGKLSMVRKIYTKDGSGNLYPFLRSNGTVYNYISFTKPPEQLLTAYKNKRELIEREMNNRAIVEMEEKRDIAELKEEEKKLKMAASIAKLRDEGFGDSKKATAKEMAQQKAEMAETEIKQRQENARLYKSYIKSGMSAREAIEQAGNMTGIRRVSETTIRADCRKYGIE